MALQVPPRERHLGKNLVWQRVFTINLLQPAVAEILDQLRPSSLPASDNDAVSVLYGLAGQDSHVHAAQDHRNAAFAEVLRQRVSRASAARDHADAHQVSLFVHRDCVHAAVHQLHLDVR